jgi:hypothetical protein
MPRLVPLSRKLIGSPTRPAELPPLTVAVKVTDWPTWDGLSEDMTVVCVAARKSKVPAA